VVRRVRFIRHAKELGFTLKEIQELLELRVDPHSSCADVRKRAGDKIADIEERVTSLERMKGALEGLARRCRGRAERVNDFETVRVRIYCRTSEPAGTARPAESS
jgi:MerR family mercuric resistance operon transcriptional regulator